MAEEDKAGKKSAFKIHDVKISLERNSATVMLTNSAGGLVSVNNFPFNPPGEQNEGELRALALREAKKVLKDAADAL